MKLNIGSHKTPLDGWLNVDVIPFTGRELLVDLSVLPWPFADRSIAEIRAFDVLEHLKIKKEVVDEMARICEPGAKVLVRVPAATSPFAMCCLEHYQLFGPDSFASSYVQTNFVCVKRRVSMFEGRVWIPFVFPFRLALRLAFRAGMLYTIEFELVRK